MLVMVITTLMVMIVMKQCDDDDNLVLSPVCSNGSQEGRIWTYGHMDEVNSWW